MYRLSLISRVSACCYLNFKSGFLEAAVEGPFRFDISRGLMISREMMKGLEPLVEIWKGWGIQVMVLLSFTMQVTLLLLADIRRRKDWAVLKVIIWSAYMMADTTAVFALGHMSVLSRSPEHQLMALWAPLLLVHLGGQDNITAYAIADYQLWLRHLQTFIVQAVGAAYVQYTSSIFLHPTSLCPATILMFVVGVLKYGERVWALMCASNCVSSSLPATRSKYFRSSNIIEKEEEEEEEEEEEKDYEKSLQAWFARPIAYKSYTLLDVAKQLFEGPTGYVKIDKDFPLEGEDALKVVEMQISMMYDFLYTKAAVVHTWYGLWIRVISLPATLAAFVLFHRSSERHGYSSRDVVVTYVLLGGAVLLETMAVVKAMFSSWTTALLSEWNFGWLARAVESARSVFKWGYWSGYMGQHNLFALCASGRKSKTSKIAGWMGREDWWNSVFNSWSTPVPQDITQSVLEIVLDSQFDITNSRGRNALRIWNADQDLENLLLEYSIKNFELDENILIWHIATHLYLTWYRNQGTRANGFDKSIAALSNYMFFLLAARPYMLPSPVNRQSYVRLCNDVINIDQDLLGTIQSMAQKSNPPRIEVETMYAHDNETLRRGCSIADFLISKGSEETTKMIFNLWLEMLCYTAYRCEAYCHAKHLSDGGEVMTTVSLLMLYMSNGLITRKHERLFSPDYIV